MGDNCFIHDGIGDDLTLASTIYLDIIDSNGQDQTNWLNDLHNYVNLYGGTNKATLEITEVANNSVVAIYDVINLVDSSPYFEIDVNFISGSGVSIDGNLSAGCSNFPSAFLSM